MALKIITLGDIKTETFNTKMFVFGPSGVGKTRLIATIPEEDWSRSLMADPDNGILSILGRSDDIKYVKIDNYKDFEELFEVVRVNQANMKWFVIDNLSEIHRKLVDEYCSHQGIPEKGAWQVIQARMSKCLRQIRDLNVNVLITCLDDYDKDENSGIIKIHPRISGKLADQLPAFFDQVAYYYVNPDAQERYLVTCKTKSMDCKDRSDALNSKEIPNMSVIHTKIAKKLKELRTKKEEVKKEEVKKEEVKKEEVKK